MTPTPFCPPGTPDHWIRPRPFRIARVELAVRIDLDTARVDGEVVHHVVFLPTAPRRELELDQVGLAIAAVEIDGVPARFSAGGERLVIALPDGCPESFAVRVRWSVERPLKGLHFIAPDAVAGRVAMAWTQGAMEDHRHWFPAFDDPNNLATYRIAITHRSGLAAIANGERVDARDAGEGWTTTTYAQDIPHVLYLVNVVVGDLVAVEDAPVALGARTIPVAHWLPRGREAEAAPTFRATGFAIRWLSQLTGLPFPWARYGHAVVHRFMWGGMENATLTTITDRAALDAATQERDDVDSDALVIHELAHQWFGDLMTMKGWSDIWLNESLATWCEARGTAAWRAERFGEREADARAARFWADRAAYLEEDGGRYRRALVTTKFVDAYELFDRVAYEKGALVLEMLAGWLGEERFLAGLRLYVRRHAHDLVETADLRQALEDATGEPLDAFFAQWVHRAGHPKLKVRARHDVARSQLVVDIEQEPAGEPFRLPTVLAWATAAGVERRAVEIAGARERVVVPCALAPCWIALDPDGTLLTDWDEAEDIAPLLARAADGRLGAIARARALEALGTLHPTRAAVETVAGLARDTAVPELVRHAALAALGAWRGEDALTALLALAPELEAPRHRRAAAKALARFRRHEGATPPAALAERLVALADGEASPLTAGEWLAARGALEHPGAAPVLRARMQRPSWNQRLRAACVRGLGDSGEPAALDDVLPALAREEHDGVRTAACAAAAELGRRHLPARDRVRRALEPLLDDASLHVRAAAARALGRLGAPEGRAALAARQEREPYGNLRRVLREAVETLGREAAVVTATAELAKRVDELEAERKRIAARLDALEKRLG